MTRRRQVDQLAVARVTRKLAQGLRDDPGAFDRLPLPLGPGAVSAAPWRRTDRPAAV